MSEPDQLRTSKLLSFFLPLGISASLVTLSHVIINSTLTRADNPELTIAIYAIAMSLFAMTERQVVMLRQTCSALVRDQVSYRVMSHMSIIIISAFFLVSFLVAYTPLGAWIFTYIFGVTEEMLQNILNIYKVLMFVSIFSGTRCFFHGIIITNMRTKWLTIGMVVRLICMYLLSLYFIHTNQISGVTGAVIFLVGMMIECTISVLEGRHLAKKLPEKKEGHKIEKKSQIFGFYRPLLISSCLAMIVGPAINSALGKTVNMELAIASFALALSIVHLVISFFSYIHQIVLNFFQEHPAKVLRFCFILSLIPTIILAIICYTPVGTWFLAGVMGANENLMEASLANLRIFMIMTLVFPWVDFGNGILMLKGQTHIMVKSQTVNIALTLIILIVFVFLTPEWNGQIGALAQSIGIFGELVVLLIYLQIMNKNQSLYVKATS